MSDSITAGDYDKSFQEHGESPKALLWLNYKVPAIRFRELVRDVPVEGRTILDAGCGMGDLLPFLYAKSPNFKYLGVDVNENFIKVAKKRYDGHEFMVADPFNKAMGQFDVVIASGILNGNVENWMEKRQQAITKLFSMSKEALAINMAGGVNPAKDTEITAFANIHEVFNFCTTLTSKIIVRASYSNRGFTIIMFK